MQGREGVSALLSPAPAIGLSARIPPIQPSGLSPSAQDASSFQGKLQQTPGLEPGHCSDEHIKKVRDAEHGAGVLHCGGEGIRKRGEKMAGVRDRVHYTGLNKKMSPSAQESLLPTAKPA